MWLEPAALLDVKLEIAALNRAMLAFANVAQMDHTRGIVRFASWQGAGGSDGKADRIPFTLLRRP